MEKSSALAPPSLDSVFRTHYSLLMTMNNKEDDQEEDWQVAFSLSLRLVLYVSLLAVVVMIVALIVKLLGICDGGDGGGPATEQGRRTSARETSGLLSKETVGFTYGTCDEHGDDPEAGGKYRCGSSSSSSSSEGGDDLYDGKICVICYDDRRNCFFVPCGHCATCSSCAQRIFEFESKTCPVCRRLIHRVRKLFIS